MMSGQAKGSPTYVRPVPTSIFLVNDTSHFSETSLLRLMCLRPWSRLIGSSEPPVCTYLDALWLINYNAYNI